MKTRISLAIVTLLTVVSSVSATYTLNVTGNTITLVGLGNSGLPAVSFLTVISGQGLISSTMNYTGNLSDLYPIDDPDAKIILAAAVDGYTGNTVSGRSLYKNPKLQYQLLDLADAAFQPPVQNGILVTWVLSGYSTVSLTDSDNGNFLMAESTPEPATLLLLGFGGVMLRKFKRKS